MVLAKGVLPRELENDLAYSSNLVGAWRLSIYIRSLDRKDDEKEMKGERQFETTRGATPVKVIWFGRRVGKRALDFVSVDEY